MAEAGSHVPSSGSPLNVTDWTYCTGPSDSGSTKPLVSNASSVAPKTSRAEQTEGAFSKYKFCPATGNRPSDAHTYQELNPPESSFPGRPPRPRPNWLVKAACTTSAVRSGRPR